ncbi:hypothetical protein ACFVTT_25760 [Streptomyces niveus]|uniref:hypothetical protein n=1 Tax=Streptomyces niveus TaxID=193462 RepID=UPI0034472F8D
MGFACRGFVVAAGGEVGEFAPDAGRPAADPGQVVLLRPAQQFLNAGGLVRVELALLGAWYHSDRILNWEAFTVSIGD